MRRPAVTGLVALTLFAAGCGIQPTGTTVEGDPPIARAKSQSNLVYFVKNGKLMKATRPGLPTVPEYGLQQLMEGPSEVEKASGVTSRVSRSTISITREGDILSLWGQPVIKGIGLAQIVCTGTAVSGIRAVRLANWQTGGRTHTCAEFAEFM
ncbi:hypothetical protein ACOZ38_18565 [Sphaerisporangium viridialbum]|uniref:hypothetical protein n=1 Tax=Sphaerisporangium viridialbum TaxID=46189 RepID=UPI003C7503EA